MQFIIIGIVIFIILILITLAQLKSPKSKKKKNTPRTATKPQVVTNNKADDWWTEYYQKQEIIAGYFEELQIIKDLYTQRETAPEMLEKCVELCFVNINSFPLVFLSMDCDHIKSLPAFERLAIIFEKQNKFKDALEIANLQDYFCSTEQTKKRINRLSEKLNRGLEDKSTGNDPLKYHFNEITKLQGSLPQKVDKILEIIDKADFKFKKITKFVDDYVIVDLETTGLNYRHDAIVEIGCIRFRNNTAVESFNMLINPNTKIPPEAIAIHHITNEMVKDAPYIDKALPAILEFIGDDIIVGHKVDFDIRFLINACIWEDYPNKKFKAIDTLNLARKYIPKSEVSDYSLDSLRPFFDLNEPAHRAMSDCEATAKVYQYCYQKANSEVSE